ncbi:hypothetical protein OQA88_3112 [Cercophora sp. LCS_1]
MSTFDVTPEREASLLSYFHRQLTYTPPPVTSPNLTSETAIITGSNTGLGLELASQLLDLGITKLILAVRSPAKGAQAASHLLKSRPSLAPSAIEVWPLDLSSYDSIASFIQRTKTLSRIDVLVNNAGFVSAAQSHNSSTGHDDLIQVNYLSQAILTLLILPVLKSKHNPSDGPVKVVFTSSDAAAWTLFHERTAPNLLAELDKPVKGDMSDRYFVSKLLMQLFVVELAKRVDTSWVVVNMATPGMCRTDLNREHHGTVWGYFFNFVQLFVAYSGNVGARMLTAAVVAGEETHGGYLGLGRRQLKP